MRLIDADELQMAHGLKDYDDTEQIKIATFNQITRWIDEAPTVETKAVNHGYWLIQFPYGWEYEHNFRCSECGYLQWTRSNYCSRCGATMDEGWRVFRKGDQDEGATQESGR